MKNLLLNKRGMVYVANRKPQDRGWPILDLPRGRWAVHELDIARTGNDVKKSVLTPFQQTHDVKNLFVMDASGFPSNPCQNPTLTIMALCVRSCDFLMDEMKKGNV